jgi:hypothetical protein
MVGASTDDKDNLETSSGWLPEVDEYVGLITVSRRFSAGQTLEDSPATRDFLGGLAFPAVQELSGLSAELNGHTRSGRNVASCGRRLLAGNTAANGVELQPNVLS